MAVSSVAPERSSDFLVPGVETVLALILIYLQRPLHVAPIASFEALVFLAALLLIGIFQVELPQGDVSTIFMPLVVNAAAFLSPLSALVVVGVAAISAQLVSRGSLTSVFKQTPRQLLVVAACSYAFAQFEVSQSALPSLLTATAVAAGAVVVDFALQEIADSISHIRALSGAVYSGFGLRGWMLGAQIAAAALGIMTYPGMGLWSVLVLVILLLVTRQSFAMLLGVRKAHQATLEALARAVEEQDPEKRGHARRVSQLAVGVGRLCGLKGKRLEQLSYAALVHDLHELQRDGSPHDEWRVAEALSEVEFLQDVMPILRLVNAEWSEGEAADIHLAYIVMVASRTDDMTRGRDTAQDGERIQRLSRHLDLRAIGEIERAFRLSLSSIGGRVFAISDQRDGDE